VLVGLNGVPSGRLQGTTRRAGRIAPDLVI
jgi:hypothetical protein